jgi:filamentous hemagglutinin family protein
MNNIYRSIWNDATGTFVAVSENTRGAGKKASARMGAGGGAVPAMKVLALSLMMAGASAWAGPVDGVVTAGAATIGGAPGSMVITQTSQNAVINWQSFNVAAGESVRFDQPNAHSVALNRVLGSDPSSILGTLSANGKVFLVNPNGILFGNGASINVGGLVASSLSIGDADFMAGRYAFTGAGNGAVTNLGTIDAPGGYVALLGAHVSNDGVIAAQLGSVALAAGNAITLDVAGDGLLNVAISEGAVNALVENGGMIQADGGQVLLSARAAGGLLQGGVNNSGVIEARSLQDHNGTIRLLGDTQTGEAQVGGTLDASGLAAGQTGGTVQVLGNTVKLAGATVDASGDSGGGLVQIGRQFHGDGTTPVARTTIIDGGTVHADATGTGNGGLIAVVSAGATSVDTTLTARGGTSNGNGGFIDTSGQTVVLGTNNSINTLAPFGSTGTWLLGASNWTIAGAGGDETPEQVRTSLASADRMINATNDITVADALVWTTGQKLELGASHNVLIKAAITASTAGSAIVLRAGNDVLVDAAITASAMGSRISMAAGRDIIGTAAVTASANGAKIAMNAERDVSVTTVTADGGGSIDLVANHDVTAHGEISADNGTVVMLADNDGNGPGVSGGSVKFVGPSSVSAMATIIRFNPVTYAVTSTEIANYATRVASGTVDARAWVFAQGDNKVYDGSGAAGLSLRDDPNVGNSVALVTGTATFDNKNVGTSKPITFNGYTLGGADQAKFALFAPFGTAEGCGTTTAAITPRPLDVMALGTNKVYDGHTADAVTLTDNRIAGDLLTVTSAAANFVDPNVGNGKVVNVTGISVTGSDAANYYCASPTAVTAANITPAPLTVQANNAAKTYGQTLVLSPSAFTQLGLVNGETIGSVGQASAGTVASAGVAGSPYAIVPSDAAGGTFTPSNYAISYVNGALTITPAPLSVAAHDATSVYGQEPVLTGFTATGLANGESVGSVTQTSPGTMAAATAPGTYAITPSNARGGTFTPSNYTIAYTNGTLVVSAPAASPPAVVPPPPAVVPPPPAVLPPVAPSAPVTPPASAVTPAPVPSEQIRPQIPPVVTPVAVVPAPTSPRPIPTVVLPPTPAGMQTLPPQEPAERQPEIPPAPVPTGPTIPEVPEATQPPEPELDVPVQRPPKQDRN